jgi:hypothetical protein
MPSRKASLTNNPLGNPKSAIQALAVEFQEYLHFPDPAPLYAVMGTIAANMIPGNPVWLMLIGPPACGGTVLLETLMGMNRVHGVSSISGKAVLLSAVSKKDRSSNSTGGLLRQIGDHGALVLKDFTSTISMPHEQLQDVMAALREIYDGKWERAVGSDGGHMMTWEGKLAMLAKCTQAIDLHHAISNDLGERWVYFRYAESDGYGASMKVLDNTNPAIAKEQLRDLVKGFFFALGMEWGVDQAKRKFTLREKTRLVSIASFAARARSGIRRNAYTREVEDVPQQEAPTRLASVLGQLFLGMELIGVEDSECWRVVGKIAMDSMPQVRKRAIEDIQAREEKNHVESTWDDLQKTLRCSKSTVQRTVEDLEILGVLRKNPEKKMWRVSDWAKGELKTGWGK